MYDQFSVGENMDKLLEERNLLGWIELIENPKLYEAVKNLSIEDQIFISYIVKEGRTQREMENIYKVDHRNIGRKFNNIIKEFGCALCKRWGFKFLIKMRPKNTLKRLF